MAHKLLHILFVLAAIVGSATAQTLSVQPIEVQAGEQEELVVSLTGATAMTALQFNLQLPAGLTAATGSATLGAAADGHTLNMQRLDSGDLLFILYSMDLKTFKDGELLRIPVTAGNDASTATGSLYKVRTASINGEDAVSHTCNDAQFNPQCAKPTIAYKNGKLHCSCATEGVKYVYAIYTTASSGESMDGTIRLGTTFSVSVYATREGYLNSETTTLTIDMAQVGDVTGDGVITIADVTALVNIILRKN